MLNSGVELKKAKSASDFDALPFHFHISTDNHGFGIQTMIASLRCQEDLGLETQFMDFNALSTFRKDSVFSEEETHERINNGGHIASMGVSAEIYFIHEGNTYLILGYHERVNPEFTDRVFKLPSTYVLKKHDFNPVKALESILTEEIVLSRGNKILPAHLGDKELSRPFDEKLYSTDNPVIFRPSISVAKPHLDNYWLYLENPQTSTFIGNYAIQPNTEFANNMQVIGSYRIFSNELPGDISIQHVEPVRVNPDNSNNYLEPMLEHRVSKVPMILAKLDKTGKLDGTFWTMINSEMQRYKDSHLNSRTPLSERFVCGNPELSNIVSQPRISRKQYQLTNFYG